MATQNYDLNATNVVTYNGSDVQKMYLNNTLIWEKAYTLTTTASSENEFHWVYMQKTRQSPISTCGKGIARTHRFTCAQMYYNLPSSFNNVSKASVIINFNPPSGWSATTSASSNKYLNAYYGSAANNNTSVICCPGGGCGNPTLGYMPPTAYSNHQLIGVAGAGNYIWGNSNVANTNAPNSTFKSAANGAANFYQRVGFVYSPGGYAWNGSREMLYGFYDPNNRRVVVQYVSIYSPFSPVGEVFKQNMNGATIQVISGGRNTNCPDVRISGNGWDAS